MASLNVRECLSRGAIGAVGAVPGTCLAHPFDVLKIRMQTAPAAAPTVAAAVRGVLAAHGSTGFYRGVTAGVQQKVLTRGPMFLAAEACTQSCELAFGMARTPAVLMGSLWSGYLTGSFAALAEWRKVLGSTAGWGGGSVFSAAREAGQGRSAMQRVHNAGCRNAAFDVTFFGVSHLLTLRMEETSAAGGSPLLGPGGCYAAAATAAVVADYPIDVATKRAMSKPPHERIGGLAGSVVGLVRAEGWGVFRGLIPKSTEFATVSQGIYYAFEVVRSSKGLNWA